MCMVCYREHVPRGTEPEMTAEMQEVRDRIVEIYMRPWGSTGGPLHVIVEDMNVGDESFVGEMRLHGYEGELGEADVQLCKTVYEGLRALNVPERAECVWRGMSEFDHGAQVHTALLQDMEN